MHGFSHRLGKGEAFGIDRYGCCTERNMIMDP